MTVHEFRLANERLRQFNVAMRDLVLAASEANAFLVKITPILHEAFRDLNFQFWLARQPRWQRPLMRLAYRIERWVLR